MRKVKNNRKSLGVYSTYKVVGNNIPLLLNKLKNNNIEVKNIKRISKKTTLLTIKYSDSEKFFAIIDNMWYNIKVKDHGFLYPLFYLTKNIGLLVGAVLLFVSIVISNDRIFDFSLTGTGSVYEREILEKLNAENVYRFTKFSSIDLNELSNKLLIDNDNLTYISLKKQGNTLKINAVKKTEKINVDRTKKSQFVCTENGVLERLTVYSGHSLVSVGQSVKKGDILVDGEVLIKDQTVNVNVLASASIICNYSFIYKSVNDNEKDVAFIFASEVLNREIVDKSIMVEKHENNFVYTVNLKYRVIIYT